MDFGVGWVRDGRGDGEKEEEREMRNRGVILVLMSEDRHRGVIFMREREV